MAKKHYTKRAEQMLDLSYVVIMFAHKLKECCKATVAHSATLQVLRYEDEKQRLIAQLEECSRQKKAGLFSWLKMAAKIKAVKKRIAEINSQIVFFINHTIKHFGIANFINHSV